MSTQTEPQATDKVTSQKGTPTWEIARLFPKQGNWTEAEYLALDTNHLVEFSDGCLEFLPMPNFFYQFILLYFMDRLRESLAKNNEEGFVLPAPLRVRTVDGHIREPDVVFVKPERITGPRTPPDGADLVAEIVSPGEESRERDLDTKRQEYARAGISEYWIIDPEPQTVSVLALEGETYREHGIFKPGQQASSVLLQNFAIDVTALFAAGQTGEKKS